MLHASRFWLLWLGLLCLVMLAAITAADAPVQVNAATTAETLQLKNDNGDGAIYSTNARTCWLYGAMLSTEAARYPLRILSVEAQLYAGFEGAAKTAEVSAVVFSVDAAGRPADLLARSPVTTVSTFYPDWVSIPMTYTQIYLTTGQPFLVGIEYQASGPDAIPAVLMDSASNIPAGKNWYSQTCGGSWYENSEWWVDPVNVGYNMVRATVATAVTVEPTWTPTPTATPTPGPSPTPIAGNLGLGEMASAGKQHVLARSPDGNVHLIYKTDQTQVVHITSRDNGGVWNPLPPLPVARTENAEAVLAASGDGALHMIYGPWDGQEVYYRRFDGSTWGAEQLIGNGAYARNIAVDNRGWVHVLWSNRHIYYTRYDGVSWSQPKIIANNGWHPALAIGPNNTLHVAYNDANYCCSDLSVEVRYIASQDGGFSWSSPQNISQDGVWSGGASLIVAPNGTVHLTFLRLSNVAEGSVIYRAWNGGSWSYPEVLSPGNAGTLTGQTGWNSPAMAVDQEGNILVVFQCLNAGQLWDVCLRIHDYFGWLGVVNLTSNVSDNSSIASIIDSTRPITGGLNIAWETNDHIVHRYLPRDQWSLRPTPTPTPTSTPTPGPIHVRVVDEAQTPVNGAIILQNGYRLTQENGSLAVTANGGVLNLTNATGGDTLLALMIQDQQPTARGQHTAEADTRFGPNWSTHTFITSAGIDAQGEVGLYQVPASVLGEHRLVVKKGNTLVLLNLVVSVQWDADDTYLEQLARAMRFTADYLYDLTDGQLTLGMVQIYDNGTNWADADVQVAASNNVRPHAYINGIRSANKSQALRIGRDWQDKQGNTYAWDDASGGGYRTIGHELGHYALGLYDEYVRFVVSPQSGLLGEEKATCTGAENKNLETAAVNASAMDYHYTATEFSARNVPGLWSFACEGTAQFQFQQESAWETIATQFGDSQSPARWSLTTPMMRNSVMAGPANRSSIMPGLPVISVNNSGGEVVTPARTLTVFGPQGAYHGAYVALYKQNELRVITQGFTNQAGQMQVIGARPGDTLRAISIDGGLAGSLVVAEAETLALIMAPVAVQSAQAGTLPYVRLLALPGENEGETELLLQLIGFGAGARPKITLVDAKGSALAPSVGYSTETGIYTSSITAGSANLRSGSVVVEAEATDRYRNNQLTYTVQPVSGAGLQEVFASDGNLSLRFLPDIQGSASPQTELVILTSSFLPGALPDGKELLGAAYDISAGAVGVLEQAALLSIYYQPANLTQPLENADPVIYRWDPNQAQWEALPTQIDAEHNTATTPITRLGAYALLTTARQPATPTELDLFLPFIRDAN